MDKQEFESAGDGIGKGDLIIVTKFTDIVPGTRWVYAYTGRYNPIEDESHWYVGSISRGLPDLAQRLVNRGYTLDMDVTFDPSRPERGIYDRGSSFPVHISYESTLSVRCVMKSHELEALVRSSVP